MGIKKMELVSNFTLWFTLLSLSLFLLIRKKSSGDRKLPPGPRGWPIIGNILDLGTVPHRTLYELRDKYGGIIWLRLGSTNGLAIVSAKAAAELFKNHDQAFADRFIIDTMHSHGYAQGSLALAPYGSFWRVLRRLVTVEMLVVKRINETAPIRRKCMDDMVAWIETEVEIMKRDNKQYRGIQVAHFVGLTLFNMMGNLVVSRDLLDPRSKDGADYFRAVEGLTQWGGCSNLADFFPWMKRFDPQGLRRKMDKDLGRALEISSTFVKERKEEQNSGKSKKSKDFMDVVMEFEGSGNEEPDKFSDHEVNIFILEMFMAASETNSGSLEWAMTELLRNPESMNKVKTELRKVIGPSRKMEETDIDNLPYLQAVIKESLRLHPALPLLVPRRATRDTDFMGYTIPKDTQIFVDAWAIGRDPEAWEDPLSFKPERFLEAKFDFKGQNTQYIPFGSGRRICAGVALAQRILHIVLGTLLHEFDWKLDDSVTLDMNDKLGMTARKLVPLIAMPKKSVF